jgi:hypothetical protein
VDCHKDYGKGRRVHAPTTSGVTDPRLNISTRLKPVDGLNHEAAVQYMIQMVDGESSYDLHLPEDSNGLGYQNLISMVFRLMSFRDAWMRVGKASSNITDASEAFVPPLHLVLIEEPEAHLHTQVQQVFIRQAYRILRKHPELEKNASSLGVRSAIPTRQRLGSGVSDSAVRTTAACRHLTPLPSLLIAQHRAAIIHRH